MKLFEPCYDMALRWARHRHATKYLGGLSFSESVFFPIPPDVMLAPMALSQPARAWQFAFITTIASILGGIAGYWLGYFAFDAWLAPLIESWGYTHKIDTAMQWFKDYGVWVVFLAGFSPIPYKIFTVSAGFCKWPSCHLYWHRLLVEAHASFWSQHSCAGGAQPWSKS